MIETGKISATHDLKFDGINIDISINSFNNLGFELGDSVNIYFSSGLILYDVPYYDGYYPSDNNFVLCGYSSYSSPCLAYEGSGAWQECKLAGSNNKVEVKLNSKHKFKYIQDTFKQYHPSNRDYYKTEESFANFRVLKAKNLKDNFIYRGASPICNDFGFMTSVNELLAENDIKYILNLSDTKEELDRMIDGCRNCYVYDLYLKNKIYPLDLSAFPRELSYARKLVDGLKKMIKNNGPVYIHCMEGKDRTGFLCILLLALTGASIADFETDYMETYANFYYIDKNNTPEKYKLIRDHYFTKRLMNQLCNSREIVNFDNFNYLNEAIRYLKYGGMKDEEVSALINYLRK